MRTTSHDDPSRQAAKDAPHKARPQANGPGAAGVAGLQAAAGNHAVVQMLRRAGHPWAQEQHEHGAGCGHDVEPPAVQRSAVHGTLRGSGRPLDAAVRTEMEARLGSDFADVRIHDDAAARASAAEIGARAYTSGSHVVIGDGGADRHTLAHELTHVIQQRRGPVAGTDNGDGLRVSDPSDRFEREAEANALRAMAGPAPTFTDTRDAAAPRDAAGGEQTVQRAPNVQDRLTDTYWNQQADGKPTHAPRPMSRPRRLEDVLSSTGPALLTQLRQSYAGKTGKQIARMGQLEIFRTMEAEEAEAIMTWWNSDHQRSTAKWMMEHRNDGDVGLAFNIEASKPEPMVGIIPVRNHLGDETQAREYLKNPSRQRLVKFTLRPGAHELFFDPQYMAVSGKSAARTPQSLRNIHGDDHPVPEASNAEGKLGGHIGVKQEDHGDFSISLGESNATQLLFQQFLSRVEIVQ